MDDEYPEAVLCPICFEIPHEEIYQCKNGHTVCNECSQSISECPQCRIPLEEIKIRNRALESLLDTMTFKCPNSQLGCTVQISRQEIFVHLESCPFNHPIKLCELLGYKCSFSFASDNTLGTIAHFETDHECKISKETNLEINLEAISDINRNENSIWKPVIMDLTECHGIALAFIILYNASEQTISPICLEIHSDRDASEGNSKCYRVEFTVKAKDPQEALDLVWTTPIVEITQAMKAIKHPPFQFQFGRLSAHYFQDNKLTISCSIIEGSTYLNPIEESPSVKFDVVNIPTGNIMESSGSSTVPSAPPDDSQCVPGWETPDPSPPTLQCPGPAAIPSSSASHSHRRRHHRKAPPLPPRTVTPGCSSAICEVALSTSQMSLESASSTCASVTGSVRDEKGRHHKPVVFRKICCNICGEVPVSTQYKCLQCANFDLCQRCMQRGEHGDHIFAIIVDKKQSSIMYRSLRESRKRRAFFQNPLVLNDAARPTGAEPAMKCSLCPSMKAYVCLNCRPIYGYCETCYATHSGIHSKDHIFAVANTERKLRLLVENLPGVEQM